MLVDSIRLLPGNNCTSAVFDPLRDGTFGAIRLEDVDLSQCQTFDEMVGQALNALTAPAIMCGSSMGGMVAIAAALAKPDKVAGLVLIGTSAAGPDKGEIAWREKLFAADPNEAFAKFLQYLPVNWFVEIDRSPEYAARVLEQARSLGPSVYFRQQKCLAERPEMQGMLNRIKCPALIIHGNDDKVISAAHAASLHQGIAGSRYRLIARCGHLAIGERSRKIQIAISAWLKRLPIA